MDPSEKYPELAAQIRGTFQIFYELGSSNLKLLLPTIKEGESKKVSWSMTGVGLGLGKDYLIELRTLSGSGKSNEFYFGTTSDPKVASDIETANGSFKIPNKKKKLDIK